MKRDEPSFIRYARISAKKRQMARGFRRAPTPSEARAWELLRDRRCLGLKFRRQQVLRGFVVDFYCNELRLVLEIDGGVHDDPWRFFHDLHRTSVFKAAGIRHELHIRPEQVTKATLHALLTPLLPSHQSQPPASTPPVSKPPPHSTSPQLTKATPPPLPPGEGAGG